MVTVLITEGMHEEGIGLLQRAGFSTVTPGDTFQVNDVQIIVVRSVFQINNETLTQYPSVKIVAKLVPELTILIKLFVLQRESKC